MLQTHGGTDLEASPRAFSARGMLAVVASGAAAALHLMAMAGCSAAVVAPANAPEVTSRRCDAGADASFMPAPRPNLVVIYADDLGWGDLPGFAVPGFEPPSYTHAMPNLARLASEGATFTHFYSAQPVCSASRAALLTGCYPNRIGIHGALFPGDRVGIAAEERTLAELLHDAGYATQIAGKWHLGHHPQFSPTLHGFDAFLGIPYSNDMWPPRQGAANVPPLPLIDGTEVFETIDDLQEQSTLTRRLTERTVGFIRDQARAGRPFFAYLPHPQPHAPIAAGDAFRAPERRDLYASVMRELDWSVGEVLDALASCGVADDTIVMVSSDNGPWLAFGSDAGSSGGLREGKGTTFEGGVRVPCIMRWPGHIPAGCVSDVPWMTIDLLPTMAAIIGAPPPANDRPIDGLDARAVWRCSTDSKPPHTALWFYYHTNALEAVRFGRWKFVLPHDSRTLAGARGGVDGSETKYTMQHVGPALYDLVADPMERKDVSAARPEVVAEALLHVEAARAELGDSLTQREGRGRRDPGR